MAGTDVFVAHYESPIGRIELRGSEAGLSGLDFVAETACGAAGRAEPRPAAKPGSLPGPLADGLTQLDEYFRGVRTSFSVKLDLHGTPFQKQAWAKLLEVGFGRTTTYKELAAALGRPAATRAVGGANHRNPVSIIVPCHRVVGSDGRLTGYGGGLWRKEWLLRHEGRDGLFV
jgi:methylated-DNA-[protein]-cysteine S-methyltransferase